MRPNGIHLALFGLGLAVTPALAQGQTTPLPGSPVYSAPLAPPTGAATSVTPAPGVGVVLGTPYSPTVSTPPAYVPVAPPAGSASSVTPAPGVGVAPGTPYSPSVAQSPAYVPATPPTGSSSSVHNAPGVGEALRLAPGPMPAAPMAVAPVVVAPSVHGAAPNPVLPMQGDVLNGGDRTAAVADSVAANNSPVALLSQADQAARQGRLPLASELVERAETLLLTRSTIAGTETIPVRDGAVARMAQARVALGRNDVPTATALMAEAANMTRALGM